MTLTTPVAAQIGADDDEQQQQIQQILSRDGPYSLDLVEPLTRLGLVYTESEDYSLALVTLERAAHIVRVNRGLHSLEQVPLMRQLIRIEEARGNNEGAWEREQDLLTLVRRYPDDVRTVPVLREIADKLMAVLASVVDGQRPPEVFLGCFYKEWPGRDASCTSGTKSTVVRGVLAEAQRNYADAIAVMLRQGLYDSDDLRGLEIEVLRGADLVRSLYRGGPFPLMPELVNAQSLEPWRSRMAPVAELASWDLPYPDALLDERDGGHSGIRQSQMMDPYHRGRQSLRRLAAYAAATDSSAREADAVVQIADWDLLYSRNGEALESYGVALAMLEQDGATAASIEEELFAPPTPIVLPAFQPNPLVPDETRVATGHIDVAFEITRFGRSRAIELLGEANATDAAKEDLLALIKSHRFRPQLADGALADAAPVTVRYYLY